MARTKASVGAKISSGKSSKARCSVAPTPTTSSAGSNDRSSRNYSGGNTVCPRETPKWQKPITNFFVCKDNQSNESDSDSEIIDKASAGSSKTKPKRNVIESDNECEDNPEKEETECEAAEASPPKNQELDESIVLEPLSGEDSHKIEEYYNKTPKGKGKGKKTKDKENINNNIQRRDSVKRDLESVTFGEESQQASKKVKVN